MEKIDRRIVRPEYSPQAHIESVRRHNKTDSKVWELMLSDEAEQQDEDCRYRPVKLLFDPKQIATETISPVLIQKISPEHHIKNII